jgi:hypothetical protein
VHVRSQLGHCFEQLCWKVALQWYIARVFVAVTGFGSKRLGADRVHVGDFLRVLHELLVVFLYGLAFLLLDESVAVGFR